MKRLHWHKLLAATVIGMAAVSGAAWGQTADTIIVLHEAGHPDRRCAIEKTESQPDGTLFHEVRDVASGERFRVKDCRPLKGGAQVIARISGPDAMTQALGAGPAAPPQRVPTIAELAGHLPTAPAPPAPSAAAAVQQQLADLQSDPRPSQREMAAMTLALSDVARSPAVVTALTRAAGDPTPSVRLTVVRCLYRIGDLPTVRLTLEKLQQDSDEEVRLTARYAVAQLKK